MSRADNIASAAAFGYEVHQGTEADGALAGRWWWTLSQDGWSGIECGPDFATEDEAWDDAVVAHASELMEP